MASSRLFSSDRLPKTRLLSSRELSREEVDDPLLEKLPTRLVTQVCRHRELGPNASFLKKRVKQLALLDRDRLISGAVDQVGRRRVRAGVGDRACCSGEIGSVEWVCA